MMLSKSFALSRIAFGAPLLGAAFSKMHHNNNNPPELGSSQDSQTGQDLIDDVQRSARASLETARNERLEDLAQQTNMRLHQRIYQGAKDGLKHVKTGCQVTWKDAIYWYKLKKIQEKTITEIRDHDRISQDLLKMVPFSIFITVPFAELLLPVYLKVFPNAMPGGFKKDEEIVNQKMNQEQMQQKAGRVLNKIIHKVLIEQGVDVRRLDQEQKISQFIKLTQTGEMPGKLDLSTVDSKTLMKIGDFMGLNLITGTKTVSLIYRGLVNAPLWTMNKFRKYALKKEEKMANAWFLNYEFKMNWGPFELLKRKLISTQIKRQLSRIRREDKAMARDGANQVPETHLREIAVDRGLNLTKINQIRKEITYQWLPISMSEEVDNSTLLWYSVLNFGKNVP